MSRLQHEQAFRGKEAMSKMAATSLFICGAGALGSNLAVNLARSGFSNITLIDNDRVEEHNIGTQVYSLDDVGGLKAEILSNLIYRDLGVEVKAKSETLKADNAAKLLKGATLVVDVFDNSASRQAIFDYCKSKAIPCLHAGVNESYGEIKWNENYIVPKDSGIASCDYPLARNLIMLVVATSSETIVNFVANKAKLNYSITLGDLTINQERD